MNGNFDAAMALVLDSEGGYANSPSDPGGATNMGITIGTLASWRNRPTSISDVQRLTKTEAVAIYRARFWAPIRCDDLPSGLDYALFDYAVNSGPRRAVAELQRVLRVPADGMMGPMTLAAAHASDAAVTVNALCSARLNYLEGLRTFPSFGKGWTARVSRVRTDALAMAAQAATVEPVQPAPLPKPAQAPKPAPAPTLWAAMIDFILNLLASLKGKRP